MNLFDQYSNNYKTLTITALVTVINYDIIIGLPAIIENNLLIKNYKHFKKDITILPSYGK